MNKLWMFALPAGVMIASAAPASANAPNPAYPVAVNVGGSGFVGSMGTAYQANDASQIGCIVEATSTTAVQVQCGACDGSGCISGHQMSCSTTDANLIATVGTVVSDATLIVQTDGNGNCTEIEMAVYSDEQVK